MFSSQKVGVCAGIFFGKVFFGKGQKNSPRGEFSTLELDFKRWIPKGGIEPPRYCYHWILSPACLPIPPLRQAKALSACAVSNKQIIQ